MAASLTPSQRRGRLLPRVGRMRWEPPRTIGYILDLAAEVCREAVARHRERYAGASLSALVVAGLRAMVRDLQESIACLEANTSSEEQP